MKSFKVLIHENFQKCTKNALQTYKIVNSDSRAFFGVILRVFSKKKLHLTFKTQLKISFVAVECFRFSNKRELTKLPTKLDFWECFELSLIGSAENCRFNQLKY